MLRAIRHAARMGFSIAPESWDKICEHHEKLTLCPTSRIRDEFFKDLHSGSLADWLQLALDSELFLDIFGLYKKTITQKEAPEEKPYREQLLCIAQVIDRCAKLAKESGKRGLPNSFLLALILVPWANARFDLCNQRLKGAAAFKFSKILRAELDKDLGQQLNLKRAIRQEMVSLLSNLPQFLQYQKNNSWPKWIKKKSYYRSCSLFCELYSESITGTQATVQLAASISRNNTNYPPDTASKSSDRRKKAYRPSFSSKSSGIFGLKRK
jgi:poly(A) polymerase